VPMRTGSVVSILALYPLDTTRTILQVRIRVIESNINTVHALYVHCTRIDGR